MKICVKCKVEKPRDSFHKDSLRKDGLFPYCRQCRIGHSNPRKKKYKRSHTKGYILLNIPDHPLSQSNGYVYEHRYIFYEKFKDSKLSCQLCGAPWSWRTYRDHIDHVDEDKSNNHISNLRPLCNACNVGRTRKIYHESKNCLKITYNGVTDTPEGWSRDDRILVSGACIRQRKSRGLSDFDALFMEKKTHNKANS